MKLTKKQTLASQYLADHTTKEILFGGGAGGGKSAFGALWLIDRCTRLPGTRWLMGRSKLKTLKDTTLKTFFEIAAKVGFTADQYNYNQQNGTITFKNGSEIVLKDLFLYPSDPEFDELGSLEITGAFIDECNQITIKAKNIVKSRIRYKLDEFNIIPKMLMTCNPAKNWVYTDFYKLDRDDQLPTERKFIQALLSDNPNVSKHYRNNLLTLDEISKQRLLLGDWEYDDDPAKLIHYDSIIDLFSNTQVEPGANFITADIARLGSDKAVIMAWSGLIVKEIKEFDKSLLTDIDNCIKNFKIKYKVANSNIMVDQDGMGAGLVDYMKVRGFQNGGKALKGNFINLKSECYYKLADVINDSRLHIEAANATQKEAIIQELEAVKSYKIDNDGKLRILPKDKVKELIGRSPDYSDTLMMRMFFEILPRKKVYAKTY